MISQKEGKTGAPARGDGEVYPWTARDRYLDTCGGIRKRDPGRGRI